MKNKKIILMVILTLICFVAFSGCNQKKVDSDVENVEVRVGAMKGPTTMGLLYLMDQAEKGEAECNYSFQMATGADELLPLMIQGQLDVALVPANVAAVLYQKTNGGICVIDINTLGVLYMVTGDASISSIQELEGKTVYLTGKGTTPDFVLQYVLKENGVQNCSLEYKSEATEVAAVLAENENAIGLLPQPFVTAACMQNQNLQVALSMNEVWDATNENAGMVTGVTIVRKDFLDSNPQVVSKFITDHKKSTEQIMNDVEGGAALCVKQGIVAKEEIAKKAIPQCNITCITGEEMKNALSGYLQILFEADKAFVGGDLPADDFYHVGN